MNNDQQLTGLENVDGGTKFDPRFEEYFREFMADRRSSRRVRPATLRNYEQAFDIFKKIMPETKLEDLSPHTITTFHERLNARKRAVGRGDVFKQGVASSTIDSYNRRLDKFFKWLKIRKHIVDNPFDYLDPTKVNYRKKDYLKRSQIERIMTAIGFEVCKWKNQLILKRNRAIFATFLYCGLRKGELLGLRLSDVNLNHDILTVRSATSKSLMTRRLPINYELRTKLEDYINERKKCNCSAGDLWVSEKDHNCGLTAPGLLHLLDKIRAASEIKFNLHRFRHTYAMNLNNKGTDISALQQLMGHNDIRMTATYTRCMPDSMKRKYVDKLELGNLIDD